MNILTDLYNKLISRGDRRDAELAVAQGLNNNFIQIAESAREKGLLVYVVSPALIKSAMESAMNSLSRPAASSWSGLRIAGLRKVVRGCPVLEDAFSADTFSRLAQNLLLEKDVVTMAYLYSAVKGNIAQETVLSPFVKRAAYMAFEDDRLDMLAEIIFSIKGNSKEEVGLVPLLSRCREGALANKDVNIYNYICLNRAVSGSPALEAALKGDDLTFLEVKRECIQPDELVVGPAYVMIRHDNGDVFCYGGARQKSITPTELVKQWQRAAHVDAQTSQARLQGALEQVVKDGTGASRPAAQVLASF